MKRYDIILRFRSREKAESFANLSGCAYMVDYARSKPEYVFAINDDIAKKLVGNFDSSDYYFTNRLCFCATSAPNNSQICVTNATKKGGGGDV